MIKNIDIDLLRAQLITETNKTDIENPIKTRLCKLEDSPHYRFVSGDEAAYTHYYYRMIANACGNKKHTPKAYREFVENFDINKYGCLDCFEKDGLYVINDGFHRAAIMKHLGIQTVRVKVLLDVNIDDFIKNELKQCAENYGWSEYGYQSFEMDGINIPAQRTTSKRLSVIKQYVNFKNKVVFDLGCNVGANLMHLPEIKEGYGFDMNDKYIYAAKNISAILGLSNMYFYNNNIEEINFSLMGKPDIVFVLSIGAYLTEWKEMFNYFYQIKATIVYETNNDIENAEQLKWLNDIGYDIHLIIPVSDDDTTGNHKRKTYICQKTSSKNIFKRREKTYEPLIIDYKKYPDSFNHDTFLQRMFTEYFLKHRPDMIIETGTCFGKTTELLAQHGVPVWSTEINDEYYRTSCNLLNKYSNVKVLLGDSEKSLQDKFYELKNQKIFFYLDSHFNNDQILERELELIAKLSVKPIILIHDWKVPDKDFGYDKWDEHEYSTEFYINYFNKIYGKGKFTITYNEQANGARRGVILLEPKSKK